MDYDVILKGGQVVDVGSMSIHKADVFIKDGIIVKISKDSKDDRAAEVIDVSGKYLAPGFVDSHLHIESTMLSPLTFAREAVKHGTTSVFVDPHEIANVIGKSGIRLFLNQSDLSPLDIFIGIPSCVPATELEDSGASITIDDIKELIGDRRVYGLAEMMNFQGIIKGLGDARERCDFVFNYGKIVDGHCPGLSGRDLETYITNGKRDGVARITSDHQVFSFNEAVEKTEKGMFVAMRYGSAEKHMDRILPGLIENHMDLSMFMLCSDDLNPVELYEEGHIDRIIRRAKSIIQQHSGLDGRRSAILAISLATINPANYFLKFFKFHNHPEIGEIASGKSANLVVLSSLEDIEVEKVIYRGKPVVDCKKYIGIDVDYDYSGFSGKVNVGKKFTPDDFKIPYEGIRADTRVIEIVEDSIETKAGIFSMKVADNGIQADLRNDIAKVAVIERHHARGSYALGFVKGLGIRKGAVASTIAHDSHNMVVVGCDDVHMADAVNHLIEIGGGMVVATDDRIICFPLNICGLMSSSGIEACVRDYKNLLWAAGKTGSLSENLFMEIAFLSLPVIPELRITNRGLVDVNTFELVTLFI